VSIKYFSKNILSIKVKITENYTLYLQINNYNI
jgi:hypothetical protein